MRSKKPTTAGSSGGYPGWLENAIGYQVFPASYQDANGDGVGDLRGIEQRLDYIADLGVNLLWLNPIYDSPFLDAGYDVRDFRRIATRYGTLKDFRSLLAACHRRGIRMMLDLVPGHTSLDHPWFLASCRTEPNRYTNRYVWRNGMYGNIEGPLAGAGCLRGYGEREGVVAYNFFWSQPKLNYGVLHPDPARPYELPFDHPDVRALWRDMEGIIRYWLDLGVDGFRIDSAKSICPDHPPLGEGRFYRELRAMFDRDYPHAALVSEWGWPCDALACGIHADFLLHNHKAYSALFAFPGWENGYCMPFFSAEGGDPREFLKHYLPHYERRNGGLIAIPSCNHDYKRPATGRTPDVMKVAFAFLLTMPGVPFVYYGDEIGMRFVHGLASKEGGYRRTGSRTPMQWGRGNGPFSSGPRGRWYLPEDPDPRKPTVGAQVRDPGSLLQAVRVLAGLRRQHPALQAGADFEPVSAEGAGRPFVYRRRAAGEEILVVLHPPRRAAACEVTLAGGRTLEPLLVAGCRARAVGSSVQLRCAPASYGVYRVAGRP